jgi:hypothetical protein
MPDPARPLDDDRDDAVPPPELRLALQHPATPVTLTELALLKGEALEVIAARVQILETIRLAAIRATVPEDWVLFRSDDGRIVSYLQDGGADRVRDLFGIEVYGVGKPERVASGDGQSFLYLITGSGRCRLTGQHLEEIEGGRSSADDFCKGKSGAELELAVRKAARANLDGNITRELAGLKAIPIETLRAAWVGTGKQADHCRLGRGFGTRDERVGGRSEKGPDVDPPVCPYCHTKGAYRPAKGDRAAFYGCPNYSKHPTQKWIVDAAKWAAQQPVEDGPAPNGGDREPGAEG